MSQWRYVWRLLPLFVVLALVLTGCGQANLSALIPKGEVAEMQLWIMKFSLYIMIGVVVVVSAIYIYVLFRFRKRPGQNEIPEQVEGSTKLEIIWTVIPIILLLILAVPTVMQTFVLAQDYSQDEDAVKIKVIARQFWWEFQYPELGITTAQDLYIPTGKKIYLELTSTDVIHSFWVPALAGKTDNNPGLTNTMWLQADEAGTYYGKCAELCGASHALMDFKVVAVSPEDFQDWTSQMAAPPAEPVTATAAQGQQVFQQSCLSCHAIGNQGGNLGPNLTNFGDREKIAGILEFNKENLVDWISDPQELKPGNKMPAFKDKLSEQEISALADYLMGLKFD